MKNNPPCLLVWIRVRSKTSHIREDLIYAHAVEDYAKGLDPERHYYATTYPSTYNKDLQAIDVNSTKCMNCLNTKIPKELLDYYEGEDG